MGERGRGWGDLHASLLSRISWDARAVRQVEELISGTLVRVACLRVCLCVCVQGTLG